ncbi:unnamed protein product [Allacma fusca]|uniref:Uncharacterized protein n=1 Tax=Allacma fusca TaxID=39272 RepID=A0A8J2K1V9_9HEXA|nr:unnamed protein product [Allacma fusca]
MLSEFHDVSLRVTKACLPRKPEISSLIVPNPYAAPTDTPRGCNGRGIPGNETFKVKLPRLQFCTQGWSCVPSSLKTSEADGFNRRAGNP